MWWALDVLDVGLGIVLDATVGQFLIRDRVFAVVGSARPSPVPVEATNVLETSHLFVGQVGQDLDHVTAIAVMAEHVVVDQVGSPDALLQEQGSADHATDDPLRLFSVSQNMSLHYYFIYYNNKSYQKHTIDKCRAMQRTNQLVLISIASR